MASKDTPIIIAENVYKSYKLFSSDWQRLINFVFGKWMRRQTKAALKDISFAINEGESVALLGDNGAGKSTLLKILAGVAHPSKGSVQVGGRVLAMLELSAGFDAEFTGRENIYIKGGFFGLTQDEIQAIEKQVVDFAELHDYIDQPLRTYSSGMKARLGFALYSHIEAEILIIDEALSVGDARFRKKCRVKVRELITKNDTTVIMATHSDSSAREFCTRGLVLKNGKLVADTDVETALKKHESGR